MATIIDHFVEQMSMGCSVGLAVEYAVKDLDRYIDGLEESKPLGLLRIINIQQDTYKLIKKTYQLLLTADKELWLKFKERSVERSGELIENTLAWVSNEKVSPVRQVKATNFAVETVGDGLYLDVCNYLQSHNKLLDLCFERQFTEPETYTYSDTDSVAYVVDI